MDVAIIGGDRRMAYLAQLLREDGYAVGTLAVADTEDTFALGEAGTAARVVLPVPLTRDGETLAAARPLPLASLWAALRPEQRICAGSVGARERAQAETHSLTLTDYMTRETLAVRNAVPTAEGAVAVALDRLCVTLREAPCLVVGFGRIGKLLARDLHALGAPVSVSARRLDDLAWIDVFGYAPLRTDRLAGTLGAFRAVFNTVPHPVLDEALLRTLRPDCLLIELASRPGIDAEAAARLGLPYVRAGGLPGRTAPESAARAIRDTLSQLWEETA